MEKIKLIKMPEILDLYKNQMYNSFFLEKKRLTIHHKGSKSNKTQMKREFTDIVEKLKPYEKYLKIKKNENTLEILL